MKLQKYKWVALGIVFLLILILVYKTKEGFVEQSDKYIYSTTSYDNKNYKNNNLNGKIQDINAEDCFKLCILESDCTGYVIDKNSCQLKKGDITEKKLNIDTTKTIIIDKIKKHLEVKKNKNIEGDPIKEYNEISYTSCYKHCIDNNRCSGFVTNFDYGDGLGKCKLYSDISDNIFKEDDKYITLLT